MKSSPGGASPPFVLGMILIVQVLIMQDVNANTIRIGGGHKRTHKNVGIRYSKPHAVETVNEDDRETSKENSFPYFVDLDGTCSGSLIAPRVVLTAAHCVEKWYPNQKVMVDPMGKSVERTVTDTVSHSNFDPTNHQYDFQLYLLDEPVTDLSVILSLNKDDDWLSEGTTLTAMGIGKIHNDKSGDSMYNVEELSISNFEQCQASWSDQFELNKDVMFCAGSDDHQVGGDSGGPVVVIRNADEHVQVGILSLSSGSPNKNVYARVSAAMVWIAGVVCEDWVLSANFCE